MTGRVGSGPAHPAMHERIESAAARFRLDRRGIRALAAMLLAVDLVGFALLIVGTHGWIVPLPRPTTTDFVSFYAAGALADAGTPALAYDRRAHLAAEEKATAPGIRYQFFNYPPVFLLLCAALARLPYLVAFVLFEGAGLALYLAVACRILGERNGTALLALLAFPIVWWNFGLGQNAFLTAALFGAATVFVDRRPLLAGLLFGGLCYKPQFAVLVPVALICAGRWRALAAAALAAAALVLLSVAAFGGATWLTFYAAILASPAMYESGRIVFGGMANPFGAARLLGAAPAIAYGVQAAAILALAAIVGAAWRGRLSLPARAAVLAAAAPIAAPLSLLYDLMLSAIAACWLVADRHSPTASTHERGVLATLCLLLLDGRGLAKAWHVPAFPFAAMALFGLTAARAWREARLRRGADA
ncbi:MAG TPA: glycosyltransferase family 87 protein [Stellaceae bacterium]|nr:glycosyltransferase family 87 protein [Stellaceae bacterium]